MNCIGVASELTEGAVPREVYVLPHRLITALCLSLSPAAALAHPHVYIDAGLKLILDDSGALTGFEVEWNYDELYSLLIIEDMGLDQDGDGVLTDEENALIQGFDSDWEPGFDGRLYPRVDGRPVALEDVRDFTAEYRDGRLISRHLHPLAEPLPMEAPLQVQVYDPEFYVDFSMPEAPVIVGREDCEVELIPGDPSAAPDAYREAIEAVLGAGTDPAEADVVTVDIGSVGADEADIRCDPGQGG